MNFDDSAADLGAGPVGRRAPDADAGERPGEPTFSASAFPTAARTRARVDVVLRLERLTSFRSTRSGIRGGVERGGGDLSTLAASADHRLQNCTGSGVCSRSR